jgi:transcriptional regulator with XRE-family HTH domain
LPNIEDVGDDEFYRFVGGKVRSARIAAGISQTLLASRVGLTRSSITNIEAARQRVPLYHFVLISRALNREISELLPESPEFQDSGISPVIEEKLADSPETMRNFVHGAVARLRHEPETEKANGHRIWT